MVALGCQHPAIWSRPDGSGKSWGEDAVDLAESAGLVLDEWQKLLLHWALEEAANGKWAAMYVCVVVARQNGKGGFLEALVLALLFLSPDRPRKDALLILWTAHKSSTTADAFVRMQSHLEAPHLKARLAKNGVTTANGKEGITLKNGARLRFAARKGGQGRGRSPDVIILDEAFDLSETDFDALVPAISARPNPMIVMTSSAALAWAKSNVLRRQRARAVKATKAGTHSGRLMYADWCASVNDDPADPATWAKGNPALGIRLMPDVLAEAQNAMSVDGFAREVLGIWDEPEADSAADVAAWAGAYEQGSTIGYRDAPVFGVDVRMDGSGACIAAAGRREDGRWHVERLVSRPGTAWVVEWVKGRVGMHGAAAVVIDPGGPAGVLAPDLEAAIGDKLHRLTDREVAQACMGLASGLAEDEVKHLSDPDMDAAFGASRRWESGKSWRWVRKTTTDDISPLYAVALAYSVARLLEATVPPAYNVLDSLY